MGDGSCTRPASALIRSNAEVKSGAIGDNAAPAGIFGGARMVWVSAVVLLAVLQYIVLGIGVSFARGRYKVAAPATTGHPVFERVFRVHQNSLEMLIAFIPAVWLYGWWVSQTWAMALGVVFLVARILYAIQYIRDPKTRTIGATLSLLIVIFLVVRDLYAVFELALRR
jgi:glutathione S-transferase